MPARGNPDKCYYCGQVEKCVKEHFYPKSKGGRYLVWACTGCDRHKADMLPDEWLDKIERTRMPEATKKRITTAVTSLIELLDTKGLVPGLAYVYARNGRIKVLTKQQMIEQGNELVSQDWKHTATFDPYVYIERLCNRESTAVHELRKLYRDF